MKSYYYSWSNDRSDLEQYSTLEKIKEISNGYLNDVYFMYATDLSLKEFNRNQQVNLIMLGFAVATGKIPFIEMYFYEEVIKEWLRDPEDNIRALHIGFEEGLNIINKK